MTKAIFREKKEAIQNLCIKLGVQSSTAQKTAHFYKAQGLFSIVKLHKNIERRSTFVRQALGRLSTILHIE